MLGKTLGARYHIIRNLGGGGFSQTYLAVDRHLPGTPRCVVKQLNPRTTDPLALQTARRLFDREAEVLYRLGNHDQLPQLLAHFEEHQEFFLVQEYIEGETLNQQIGCGKRFLEADVLQLIQDILEILEFVHQQHVIHRDIKPSNLIRRQRDNRIVLIDFGAVKQMSSQLVNPQGQTSFTIAIGSPGYVPNEQLAGKPRFSSDIYAVGMIGILALTGLQPKQLREDPRTSEIVWRNQVNVSPELADILDKMVRCDFRERYQSATEALQAFKLLTGSSDQVMPADPEALYAQGNVLYDAQRYEEALAAYEKVLQLNPNHQKAWFMRGNTLNKWHRYEEVVASYDKAVQLKSDDYVAWFRRGIALENLQWYEQAAVSYHKVVQIQPDNYWAWHDRGKMLEKLQQYEEAAACYNKALQIKPDFTLAIDNHRRMMNLLGQIKHYEEALISYDREIQVRPDDYMAWFRRGTALQRLQRYEKAAASYDKVVQIKPDNYLAWNDRGKMLEKLQRYEEAIASYNRAIQIKPDFQLAIEGRKRVLIHLETMQPKAPENGTDELLSEPGVDYTRLRDLLAAGKWKQADRETAAVMLKAAGRDKEGWLRIEDFETFPCQDLHTINQLWVKYSNQRFGFSIQRRIWQSIDSQPEVETDAWCRFGEYVGWRVKGTWKSYRDLTFALTAPVGHLPLGVFGIVRCLASRRAQAGRMFFTRGETCKP